MIRSVIPGLLTMLLGAFVLWELRSFPPPFSLALDPGLPPRLVAILLLIAGAFMAVPRRAASDEDSSNNGEARARHFRLALPFFLSVIALGWLGFRIGIGVSMFVFLLGTFVWLDSNRRWFSSAVVAAAVTAGVYAVFGLLMRVPLPRGWLF